MSVKIPGASDLNPLALEYVITLSYYLLNRFKNNAVFVEDIIKNFQPYRELFLNKELRAEDLAHDYYAH